MKKLLPLALAINLMLSQTAVFAAETTTPSLTERVQKILHRNDTPAEEAPAAEQTPTTEESPTEPEQQEQTDPDHAEQEKTKDTEAQQSNGTTWDGSGLSPCPQYAYCDGQPTAATSDWSNILSMIGILFGDSGASSDSTGAGINGNSGYDTIGIPTDTGTGDNTSTVDVPQGDFSTITPAGEADPAWSDVPASPDLSNVQLGILGGIPISANASYTYSWQGPGSFRVLATVNPANPEIDQTTTFSAMVTPTIASVHVSPSTQSVSETYTQGGDYYKVFTFNTIEYAKNSRPRYGKLTVKVNAKVYEGSTSLCSSDDADCNNGLVDGKEFDQAGNTTGGTTSNTESTDIGGTITNPDTNTGTNTTGGTSTGGTTTDDFGGLTGTTGTSSNNGSSGLLDNIFGSTGTGSNATNNANNPDWLQDGFSNIASNGGSGDTMGDVPADFGSQFADTGAAAGTGTDGTELATGSQTGQNATEYAQTGQPYANGENGGNSADSGSADSAYSPASTSQNENPADGALGSVFSKIDSAIGNDPASAGSLTSKFAALTNKTNSAIESATGFNLKGDNTTALPGNARGLSSDSSAELREMATRMLNANGMSQADIAAGKQYAPGSAYTDPQDAWNLNRMTKAKAQAAISQNKNTNSKTATIE